jgi:serine/threonine protein kinase
MFQAGDVIEGGGSQPYRVKGKLGEGQFAEVYEVEADAQAGQRTVSSRPRWWRPRPRWAGRSTCGCAPQYALKIERDQHVRTVEQELRTVRRLHRCSQTCQVHDSGEHQGRTFFVMDLLGDNLAATRQAMPHGRADLHTAKVGCRRCATLRHAAQPRASPPRHPPSSRSLPRPGGAQVVGMGMLRALEQVHSNGYIHRDVKPANFCIRPPKAAPCEGGASRDKPHNSGLARPAPRGLAQTAAHRSKRRAALVASQPASQPH